MAEQVIRAFKTKGLPVVDTEKELIGHLHRIEWTGPLTPDMADKLAEVVSNFEPRADAIWVHETAEGGAADMGTKG